MHERIIQSLIEVRDRLLRGDVNCIPSPFSRFLEIFPGIEQAYYYLITASTKVGKSQLSDFLFLYTPFFFALNNPDKVRIKIFYFTLEMSAEEKYRQFISALLYVISSGDIRLSTKELRSVSSPLSKDILDLISSEPFKKYFTFFDENIVFIDDIRNPTGINKFCRDYAIKNGTDHLKTIDFKDKNGNITETKQVHDFYELNDPNEWRIVIIDHYKLFTTEQGFNLKDTIGKWSNDYAVRLRNNYKYTIVGIQQQMPTQEGIENLKLKRVRPSIDGLSENKSTAQDANLVLGLYSPARYEIGSYLGFDITKFKDNIRFMEALAGREGGGGSICPLYFDGAVNYFEELPLPQNETELTKYYKLIESNRKKTFK